MAKITKVTFQKHLFQLDRKEMAQELLKLFGKFDNVRQFYQMDLGGDTSELLNVYKEKIRKEYFPNRGFGEPKASIIRKILSDFKKVSVFEHDLIDLLLYRVELGVRFTNEFGDIDEPFYRSVTNSFDDALKLITENISHARFQDRCAGIVLATRHIGWGFHDDLLDGYVACYGEKPRY